MFTNSLYSGPRLKFKKENEIHNSLLLQRRLHPDTVEEFKLGQIFPHGNVLSIYDSSDDLAGSCQELFTFSEDNGISSYDEVILHIGTGHGILYEPRNEWMLLAVQRSNNETQ